MLAKYGVIFVPPTLRIAPLSSCCDRMKDVCSSTQVTGTAALADVRGLSDPAIATAMTTPPQR